MQYETIHNNVVSQPMTDFRFHITDWTNNGKEIITNFLFDDINQRILFIVQPHNFADQISDLQKENHNMVLTLQEDVDDIEKPKSKTKKSKKPKQYYPNTKYVKQPYNKQIHIKSKHLQQPARQSSVRYVPNTRSSIRNNK